MLADGDQHRARRDAGVDQRGVGIEGCAQPGVQARLDGHPRLCGVLAGDVAARCAGGHDEVDDPCRAMDAQRETVGPTGRRLTRHLTHHGLTASRVADPMHISRCR